ncbi:MAG TPA: IgGFc-binding protein, partial [Candidatus Dormibacteraeota bacterium]|nr:IgGFc-binding protein [Candidatus Dormibacteraeota bacterium]
FPGNYAPDPTNPPVPQLFIAGPAGVAGTVSMPLYGTWPPAAFTIPPGGVATVTLPAAADLGNANDVVETNGIHVVASLPVAVYGLNHIPFTSDAFLGLSTRGLGLAHYVMAYRNVFTGVPELNGTQLALAAAQDNTIVTIVPSANVGTHPGGVPFNLTLMQGQTYQLRDTNDAPADLSGTFVLADQPVAVFGGHQVANIPSSNQFFANYIVEQMPPTETWGVSFITAPLAGRLSGDTFRIMAMQNGTTVTVNGSALSPLNRGKFRQLQLAGSSVITADKPVLVAQFADSSDFDSVLYSDPFMVLLPPISSYSTSYILQTPTADFPTNYINLMAPSALVGQILLDGAFIPAAAYSPVGASGFFTAQV